MLKVIFTLDYEIHGNGDGCPESLMVEPTRRLLALLDRYGAKLTIMADVAEILKFREYREQFGRDDYHYAAIANQLRKAVEGGHDVQLHLHSSYFNAQFKDGHWEQDWSEYNFASLPPERMDWMVRAGKTHLEELLRPVNPGYECVAFRAANWSVSPARNVVRSLANNGVRIDTSVFKYGRREGIVNFDYSNAPSDLIPWPVHEEDICRRKDGAKLIEVPIYCERRWIGAFLSPGRVFRARMTRAHSVAGQTAAVSIRTSKRGGAAKRFLRKFSTLTQRHAWKADFNQCTGRQLIAALRRAARKYSGTGGDLPFVLIGHSKQFTQANERSLEPFLEYVGAEQARYRFANLSEITVQ